MGRMIIVLLIFLAMYAGMIISPKYRVHTVWAAVLLFIATGTISLFELPSAIDWNVLMMIAGTMGTVWFFIDSGMPSRLGDMILGKVNRAVWVIIAMSLFSGLVSAFIDNVATVLMLAPVGLAICKKLHISPIAMMISISVSSNLQGAATLVGDTTSILLSSYAKMTFWDFIVMNGKPGIFWAVELGAIATVPVMYFLFHNEKAKINVNSLATVKSIFPSVMLLLNIVLLIAASFAEDKPACTNGAICLACFMVCIICSIVSSRGTKQCMAALKDIDFVTMLQLAGLFIVIFGITKAGVIDMISSGIVKVGGKNVFVMYTIIVWGSVICSAFIDNIPYVATMLPVVGSIAGIMGCNPLVLSFGLLIGATLGGNITPIGASANIAMIGILNKDGHKVESSDFMRIGIPFTLVAVLVGYIFIWFVWA